ncbi:hypothetical protein OROGR_006984 [Orobanche gracilis]
MDSMTVNWKALDALVVDFAKAERLIDDSSPTPSSSTFKWRLLISQIRRALESGDIDSSIDLLRANAPTLLDDHRLLLRLQKQNLLSYLRKGTDEDRDSAIKCVRTSLAQCALDAYPEAYEEFKHVFLALIYGKDDQTSPVVNEWAESRRFEIAGLLASVLRSIHKEFCLHQGVSSPISDLTERLLLEERDPPVTPQGSLTEAPPFDEVDIQALAHAVELTRQGAIDSLRFSKGDLHQAFQNELCRMRVDIPVLDKLVREYCIYRGIVDSTTVNSELHATSGMANDDQLDPVSSITENCSIGSDSDMSVGSTHMEGFQHRMELVSTHVDMEVRYPCETTSFNKDCSTSRTHQPEDSKVVQVNRSRGTGERRKRKRWMGRDENLEIVSEAFSGSCKNELSTTNLFGSTHTVRKLKVLDANLGSTETQIGALQDFKESSKTHSVNSKNKMEKFEIILDIKELASEGMATEVIEEIKALDPDFFTQNSALLFQLKQVEFLKLVHVGDYSRALKVASSYLGPLAAEDPALLKPMKETLLAFLRSTEEPIDKHLSFDVLATSLQVAVSRKLGLEEPQLMKIIRATLHAHSEWFKLQMCKDQFEGLLWINSLKELGSPLLGDGATKSAVDTYTQGSSPLTVSSGNMGIQEDGSSPSQISSSDFGCDENAILKVMEFVALTRADAIHLLVQFNGSAKTVIQQMFTS